MLAAVPDDDAGGLGAGRAGPARKATTAPRKAGARKTTRTARSSRPTASAGGATSDGGVLPAGFRFGVATAGFQIEGGFNGPGEPANNWVLWERAGRVEPSGIAIDFWNRYEEHLDRAAAMGCDAFRLGVEWARVEPEEGRIDRSALDRYGAILTACRARGMEPLVTLHHFTHPAWLGEDFWLSSDAPHRYGAWVETAVSALAPRCTTWVTLNEVNALALGAYLLGIFPPGRRMAFADAASALDHLLAAHVRGYEVIHRIQPEATVTTNNVSLSFYELDRMLIDVLAARHLGVRARGARPVGAEPAGRLVRRSGPGRPAGAAAAAGDGVGVDIGRASARRHRGGVGQRPCAARSTSWVSTTTTPSSPATPACPATAPRAAGPGRQPPTCGTTASIPAGLGEYARASSLPDLDVWVVENGLCNRVRRGRSFPRLDGWDRVRYLQREPRCAR